MDHVRRKAAFQTVYKMHFCSRGAFTAKEGPSPVRKVSRFFDGFPLPCVHSSTRVDHMCMERRGGILITGERPWLKKAL